MLIESKKVLGEKSEKWVRFRTSILYLTKTKKFLTWNWNALMLGWPLHIKLNYLHYIYIYIYIWVRSDAILCSFLIIKLHIVLHDALQFTTTCGSSMQLLYFAGSFVWFECSHTIWWTLLMMSMIIIINESLHSISQLE